MVFDRVKDIIASQFGLNANDITMKSDFVEDIGADSLDIVEFIMAMEDEFDIEFPEEEAENISTVGDVVDYIKANTDNI